MLYNIFIKLCPDAACHCAVYYWMTPVILLWLAHSTHCWLRHVLVLKNSPSRKLVLLCGGKSRRGRPTPWCSQLTRTHQCRHPCLLAAQLMTF
jgi:hypothetical protein